MSDILVETRNALLTQLISSTIRYIDSSVNIAFSNDDFDPDGMNAWLDASYMPVEESNASKCGGDGEETGLFQVSVYVPLNDRITGVKNYDTRAWEMVGDIRAAFKQNESLTFNQTSVTIEETTYASPIISESWFSVPVTINYRRI